jgi:hypothetical protein
VSRETGAQKAARYLAEGRLTVTRASGDHIAAFCRGAGGIYPLGHEPGRGWWCNCPARVAQCAHLTALQLVTTTRRPG